MRKEASWMTKVRSTSSLVMTQIPKARGSAILIRGMQSSLKMSISMKKENGIKNHMMETITFFFFLCFKEVIKDPSIPSTSPIINTQEDERSS